ncbi:prepilin-type N-terminal cleavage/methylation domain-containing protein [Anoxynatronum buryatiense]|uniref:Type IV pilin N-term methylation site GFxxxE n=1 Tax=Anoxynatronum buryatiense TaxID=489973 RepID=A0AA45WUS6_9CLOT|nr:prepilin-type N-terminal cleavage/methylation domain-containing protein [Anoxynatronum buryatiense]SMP48802.1 Type IV pilin N-term methylation site GFxxxE [Anoxynatronum buryatiense]
MLKSVKKNRLLFTHNNRSGITLIELIIAIAIALMVLTVSFSVFSFGNSTFRQGVNQYDIQSDIRLASDYIQNQVRYATFIKLIDTPTFNEFLEFDEGDPAELLAIKQKLEYIYFDENNRLNHVIFNSSNDTYSQMKFRSSFTLPGSSIIPDQHMLIVQVDADDRDANYQLNSKINLPNMQLANYTIEADGNKGILFSIDTDLIGLISEEGGLGGPGGGSGGSSDDDDEESSEVQTINLALIGNLTKPVHNGTPVTTFATDQYTATVSWNPNPFEDSGKFKNNTIYTATVIITPKVGYTVIGLLQNFFHVTGANTTTNPANSNIITAVFPST